jgi:hypothetical protein
MVTPGKTAPSSRPATARRHRSLRRVAQRPSREQWKVDEPMTIAEAVALDVTAGALSEKGIRTAIENGALSAAKLNGKFWITIRGVRAAFAPSLVPEMPQFAETANDGERPEFKAPTRDERVLQILEDSKV